MIEVKEIIGDTCGTCKMLKPVLERIFSTIPEDEGKLTIINIKDDEGKELIKEYTVGQLPALLFFKDDVLVDRHGGQINPVELKNKIHNLL